MTDPTATTAEPQPRPEPGADGTPILEARKVTRRFGGWWRCARSTSPSARARSSA